jgi:hypothetical protein
MGELDPLEPDAESDGGTDPPVRAPDVKLNTLALVACGLAILSFLLLPGLFWTSRKFPPVPLFARQLYQSILVGASILAAILGLVSVAGIAASGGRLTGRAFAWIGASAPAVQFVLYLLLILPALPRSVAFRMTCGTNLSGIGKAMMVYANDYEDEFPRAAGPGGSWAVRTVDWMGQDCLQAYGVAPGGTTGGQASISASLYLLVKYVEVMPKSFVCDKGEPKTKPFDPARYRVRGKTLSDLWDFGPDPPKHVSYAYHMIYGPHKLTTNSEPGMAIAADRNPWMDSPFAKARDFSVFTPDIAPFNGTTEQALSGNAIAHKGDGQNVLFVDSHVGFEKRTYCGVDDDNIYTSWDGEDKTRGKPAQFGSVPAGAEDSLLVNDPASAATVPYPDRRQ